jgi:hypothetical protein
MRSRPNHSVTHLRTEITMKTSLKIRAAAMLASTATTFVLLHWVALLAHPSVETTTETAQIAGSVRAGGA